MNAVNWAGLKSYTIVDCQNEVFTVIYLVIIAFFFVIRLFLITQTFELNVLIPVMLQFLAHCLPNFSMPHSHLCKDKFLFCFNILLAHFVCFTENMSRDPHNMTSVSFLISCHVLHFRFFS